MSMLAELVELVIGVDTHTDTHTAALVAVDTRALLATITITADGDGYAELLALAEQHGGLRAWAIEGASGYGAGLTRHLAENDELVVELDRPVRPARRAGAKSDVIDAERAARDALSRTKLATPEAGPQRAALQALLTARRSAVNASTTAQRQLRALVITAPEPVRARFRGHTTRGMIDVAARVRPGAAAAAADVETFTALSTLRSLARRIRALDTEATEHEHAIRAIVRAWGPDLLAQRGSARSSPRSCSPPGPTPAAAGPTPRSPCSPAPHPSPPRRARPCATGSTAQATANSTTPCTPSPCHGSSTTPTPTPTPTSAATRAKPTERSNSASSATSPASSTASSRTHPHQPPARLDET